MRTVSVLQVPIHVVTQEEALERIELFIHSGRPHQLATVNAEFIIEAQRNPAFRRVLQQTDLSLADSTAVTWAARYLGHPLPRRIPGADLVIELAQVGSEKGWEIYLVGGAEGVAEAAAKKLKLLYPNLAIVEAEAGMVYDPKQPDEETITKLVERIKRAKPDVLLVAFGAPKQELFIAQYKRALAVPVMIGVGGTFDFLSGRRIRAPKLLRMLGLEWLWRLIQEPSRWRRIFTAVVVFPLKVIFS